MTLPHQPQLPDFHRALAALPGFAGIGPNALRHLPTKGISHDHIAVNGRPILLRIPRFSQWGAGPAEHLAYEQAAFIRAKACRHVPKLHAILPVSPQFPSGALIVERISGRPPQLPGDLTAIAKALAALHNSKLPPLAERVPLINQPRPFAETIAAIEVQATDLEAAHLAPKALQAIQEELAWARDEAATETTDFPAIALVGTDTHPGNFLIDIAGKAWFVDLEKTLYGAPPIDLAHTTLATSTGWDPDSATGQLEPDQVREFYATYLQAVGPARAKQLKPWLIPMRRLTWLRTMTWFARWRARWCIQTAASRQSQHVSDHIAQHIANCFAPATIQATRREWLEPATLNLADLPL